MRSTAGRLRRVSNPEPRELDRSTGRSNRTDGRADKRTDGRPIGGKRHRCVSPIKSRISRCVYHYATHECAFTRHCLRGRHDNYRTIIASVSTVNESVKRLIAVLHASFTLLRSNVSGLYAAEVRDREYVRRTLLHVEGHRESDEMTRKNVLLVQVGF